jgi:ketosteroid isomerase-like protein
MMGTSETVGAFIAAINSGNLDAISHRLAEDHVFVDSLANRVVGKEAMEAGWRAYLAMFPDYRITAQILMSEGDSALLCGTTSGTFHRVGSRAHGSKVTLHAAWRAIVANDKIALWQVYADNKPVYDLLS